MQTIRRGCKTGSLKRACGILEVRNASVWGDGRLTKRNRWQLTRSEIYNIWFAVINTLLSQLLRKRDDCGFHWAAGGDGRPHAEEAPDVEFSFRWRPVPKPSRASACPMWGA